jgi:hypothetical protein
MPGANTETTSIKNAMAATLHHPNGTPTPTPTITIFASHLHGLVRRDFKYWNRDIIGTWESKGSSKGTSIKQSHTYTDLESQRCESTAGSLIGLAEALFLLPASSLERMFGAYALMFKPGYRKQGVSVTG